MAKAWNLTLLITIIMQLTSWNGVFFENIIVAQLVKKFNRSHWTPRFDTAFTKPRRWTLSWDILISSPIYNVLSLRQILLIIFPSTTRPLPSKLSDQNIGSISHPPPPPSARYNFVWFYNKIRWRLQIMKLFILQVSRSHFINFLSVLRPNISLSTSLSDNFKPQTMLFPYA
jgi:hypothetical protein